MTTQNKSGLICRDCLPIRWGTVTAAQWADEHLNIDQVNQERLRIINNLDDHRPEALEDHPGVAQELQKLDFKLNLILEMLGQLISVSDTPPVAMPVLLAAESIAWSHSRADSLVLGEMLKVDVFLHPRYPFPLSFVGKVVTSTDAEMNQEIQLVPMSEQAQELYEKYLFKCHRRQIARERQKLKPIS